MYKSKEFDYDLWTTTENGTKHYWARVKATGEVTEVSHEVMKFLRAEEKRVYREIEATQNRGSTLSLDVSHDEEKEYWLEDNGIGVSEMEIPILEEEFCKLLTANQLEIYKSCMIGHCGVREYARRKNLDPKTVSEVIAAIRKKFKNFFGDTPTNA
jgi:hypothetical protein